MKVLLVFFTDPPRAFSTSVAALSAVVRACGHEPRSLEVFRKRAIAEIAAEVEAIAPDVLAISSMSRDWPGARALLELLRQGGKNYYIVVGGYHASLAPGDVAGCPAVDAIAIGEGERPLAALLAALGRGERPRASRPGLWVRGSDGDFNSYNDEAIPGADPEPDIAALPWWDYEVFGDVGRILEKGLNTFGPHVDRYLPTRASRGCPFTCAYCSAPRWGKLQGFALPDRNNVRPVEDLCDELAALRARYEPEGFEFWDEHFPLKLEWLREFARVYPRRVGLPFKVEMHPNAATRERLALLAEAGCALFHCGIEAGDPALRQEILNRRTSDARLQAVFDNCRELGIATSASLMTMLPGETRAMTRATVGLLERLQPDSFMWSTYQPLPGTVLGEAAVPGWPGPARVRFDDFDEVASRTPAQVSAEERRETFRELAELQSALVQIAGVARARPVEIPRPREPAPPRLAALLGLAPAGATLTGPRVNRAAFEQGVLMIEIEGPGLAPHEVRIGFRNIGKHFVEAGQVGLAYRGREAPTALLQALVAMARHFENNDISIEMLRAALEDDAG